MTAIALTIPGKPCGQPRARATTVNGHARMYEADKSHPIHVFKAAVRMAFRNAGGERMDGPLQVAIKAVYPRPKAKTWKTRPMPWEWDQGNHDADNIAKACLDALNGVAYSDDKSVSQLVVTKIMAAGDEEARTEIRIRAL